MIGEDEGIQWGALSLLIVTTNVVVLCEYLPQEFPLWGTIKGYCIVPERLELGDMVWGDLFLLLHLFTRPPIFIPVNNGFYPSK